MTFFRTIFTEFANDVASTLNVIDGDTLAFKQGGVPTTGTTFEVYATPDVTLNSLEVEAYDFLDLYNDIPIQINRIKTTRFKEEQ